MVILKPNFSQFQEEKQNNGVSNKQLYKIYYMTYLRYLWE